MMRMNRPVLLLSLLTFFALVSAQGGVILTPLDPFVVDTTYASVNSLTSADIQFVNQTSFSVDVYWINFTGDRVFYNTVGAGLSYFQGTFITHPWLIVEHGTGGTTAQGTGTLITAFLPVTPSATSTNADIANITAPEPSTLLLVVCGLVPLALRRGRKSSADQAYPPPAPRG